MPTPTYTTPCIKILSEYKNTTKKNVPFNNISPQKNPNSLPHLPPKLLQETQPLQETQLLQEETSNINQE